MRYSALLLVFVIACGGSSGVVEDVATLETTATATAPTTTTTVNMEVAAQEAVNCFRAEGIDFPDPTLDANGNVEFDTSFDLSVYDQEELSAAQAACSEELSRVIMGFVGTDLTGLADGLLEYAVCMRENGFDLPDPDFGDLAGSGPFGEIDQDDPDFQAADEACRDVLQSIVPGS